MIKKKYIDFKPPRYLTVPAIVITPIAICDALRTMFSKNEKCCDAIISLPIWHLVYL